MVEQTQLFDAAANKASKQDKRQALTNAAYWHAQFGADDVSQQDKSAWQAWLTGGAVKDNDQCQVNSQGRQNQALLNQWAWQQVERLQTNLPQLPNNFAGNLAVDSLTNLEPHINLERRMAMRSLMVIFGTGSVGWLGYQSGIAELADLMIAEQSSKTGEIRTLFLPDGAQVILNTASAIDILFSATERRIILRHGEIMVQTANVSHNNANTTHHDSESRPFIVQTELGSIQALGTRFSVREFNDNIEVNVYQHSVRVTTNTGKQQLCPAGKSLSFTPQHISALQSHTNNESWTTQMLTVNDMPLTDFVNEISRYRVGVIRCHASLAQHHISGAFNTADTEQIIRALTKSFPIKVSRFSRYWLNISPR